MSEKNTLIARLRFINDVLAQVAGAVLLGCVLLILVDIVTRQLGRSLGGSDEIAGYVMAITMSWASAYALTELAHVRIDFLRGIVPTRAKAILDVLSISVFASVTVFVATKAWSVLAKSLETNAHANTPLETPLWIPQLLWWSGWVWFAITAVCLCAAALKGVFQGELASVDAAAGITQETSD